MMTCEILSGLELKGDLLCLVGTSRKLSMIVCLIASIFISIFM